MIRRGTWIVVGLFVALLAVAVYWQRTNKGGQGNVTPTAAPQLLFAVRPEVVQSVDVQAMDGRRLVLDRDVAGAWALAEPQAEKTDTTRAESSVSAITNLEVETTLEQPPALEAIGLAPSPAFTITLVTNDQRALTFKVGKETPTKNGYYVLGGDGKVQIVEKFLLEEALDALDNPPVAATPAVDGEPIPTAPFP